MNDADSNPSTEQSSTQASEGHARTKIVVEDDRTGMHPDTVRRAVLDHLLYTCMKAPGSATMLDVYQAVAHAVRDRLVQRWIRTQRQYTDNDVKRVYYLSAEFLMGRFLGHNLLSLDLFDMAQRLLQSYGVDLNAVLEQEHDPGLGNGGLGRLAACFLDSMATMGLPGYGYGIRYEYGIFMQEVSDGYQVERGDAWLSQGTPWEMPRHEYTVTVPMYGRVEERMDEDGVLRVKWVDTERVLGVPYDTPVAGYGNNTVNTLRLWAARATKEFNFSVFNDGDYRRAVEDKSISETISKVLYPNDDSLEGRELRLKQQYFFVCCSIQDIMRRYRKAHDTFDAFPDKVAIQLNDTHPAITVAELMRVLLDVEGLSWDRAWAITHKTVAYTNHTLLPEALETWPVSMFERLLPRHLGIIYEINRRFLRQVQIHSPGDDGRLERMSIVAGGDDHKKLRMAHLAVVGSHSVNGVAQLHSELVRKQLLPDFAEMWPEKFNNKTNGVTPRRWIMQANPRLTEVITRRLGPGWITDLDQLEALASLRDDPDFLHVVQKIKRQNKQDLSRLVLDRTGVEVDADSLFDVHVKRLHEYKRQLLNCLHIVALYQSLKADPSQSRVPRTFIFGGKAAPGYAMAKLHIKLINDVADTINADPAMRGRLRVVFLPNYGVSMAQTIIPGTDVSEQISMAGKEASGTGNMKFAMNGALTVGTLDGANIEIRDAVGEDNFFLFGLDAPQVAEVKRQGYYPAHYIERSDRLRGALEMVSSGFFSPDDKARFETVIHSLWNDDPYLVCADFESYWECHERVDAAYQDEDAWTQKVVSNLAHMGRFSSDRTIGEYAREIWGIEPLRISMEGRNPIEID
ncbi:glycogen/starch/alpha-glucan phosphorylase [Paraliomyxa miuraensis]|uniref:glycogen/starch/alpha-glucan phosphorylase n=1 Tax=Paraliomyxa miuraensis TaxID=376150 RepID=UPI00224CF8F2|nr:glycogen/starch/alpha-glucan phosphorylase [Paraliomyxa miuraensis]MCX4246457.1 glycogen/starch/alpha-glucan phosphorylase [Paraliomyxa miuraensis]